MIEVTELTPRGRGGVSVIRLRGPGARAAAARLSGCAPQPGAPRLVRLQGSPGLIDVALFVDRGPDEVELHVHGSPVLVRLLQAELAGEVAPAGARAEDQALDLLAGAA